MLDHPQGDLLGQIEHLPRLTALNPLGVAEIPATTLARLGLMPDALIGGLDPLQMSALMALLATRLATR